MSRRESSLRGRMVFVVGVRRSGTNWLGRILGAHPDVSVIPGETYLFSHGIAPLDAQMQHGLAGSARTGTLFVDRGDYLDAVRDLCDRLVGGFLATLDRPGRLVVERTPDHVRSLDLIGAIYPDAAVVHLIRDGRDVARSLVSQQWGPRSYAEAATEWVSGVEQARASGARLARYTEVRYEAMLTNPGDEVPALYRFLGLSDDEEVIRRALVEASVPFNVDPGASEVASSKWKTGLPTGALAEVLDVAAGLLDELGYDVGSVPRRVSDKAPRSPVSRLRDVGARVGRLRRRSGTRDGAEFNRAIVKRFDGTMALVDELMADVAARRFAALERHFGPNARIRVVRGADSWDARGPAAVSRLAQEWSIDPALGGRQVRGDVHPGVPSFTVMTSWRARSSVHDRLLVVTRYADRISELVWYVLPRSVPEDHSDGGDAKPDGS